MSENQRSYEIVGQRFYKNERKLDGEDDEWVAEEKRCVISDPAQPHYLTRRTGNETKHDCFSCGERSLSWDDYYCTICQVGFHKGCFKFTSKMIHSYHPQHPLSFTFLNKESETIVDTNFGEYWKVSQSKMSIEFSKTSKTIPNCSVMFDKCTWCGNDLGEWFYRCLICNFSLDRDCAQLHPPLTIQNPKNHQHSLFLFPRPLSFPCNACGLINLKEPGYACYQCNYVVHQCCIDLPRVIKITRHHHRLFYTPYLPTKVSICRVCYKNVDIKYGQYSCNREGCSYVAHSKCATHRRVWNKKELEWEPEKSDKAEDVKPPYKKVGDGLIEHFCHDHHYLKLEQYNSARDSKKKCQACMRSITSQDFYNCIECHFYLHESCANLPKQLDHLLHIHSLVMDPFPLDHHNHNNLYCRVCSRESSGWRYICTRDGCQKYGSGFQVDVNCILVPECFTHGSHLEHPLFISTTHRSSGESRCQSCKKSIYDYCLHCTTCEFILCFECVTIPNELYYKYDERPLSLCYGESEVDNKYWCELCETSLDPTEWYYTNKEFCTTIHLKCLFGDSSYMKSGHAFNYREKKVVVRGNSSTRPVCYQCHQRCAHSVYLKVWDKTEVDICSFSCLMKYYYH